MEDIEEYLQGMEQLIKQGYSERKFKDFSKLESQFTKRKRSMPSSHPSPPSSEQMERYIQLAVTLLNQGYSNLRERHSTLSHLAHGLMLCDYKIPSDSPALMLFPSYNEHR